MNNEKHLEDKLEKLTCPSFLESNFMKNMRKRDRKMTREKAEELQAISNMCNVQSKIAELHENGTVDWALLVYEEDTDFLGDCSAPVELITDTGTEQLFDTYDEISSGFEINKHMVVTGNGKKRKTYLVFDEGYIINIKDLSIDLVKQMNVKLSPDQMRWIRIILDNKNNSMIYRKLISNHFSKKRLLYNNNLYIVANHIKYDKNSKLQEIIIFITLHDNRKVYFAYNNKEYMIQLSSDDVDYESFHDVMVRLSRQILWVYEDKNVVIISNILVHNKITKQTYLIRETIKYYIEKNKDTIQNQNVIEGEWIFILGGTDTVDVYAVYNIRTHTLYDVEAVYSEGNICLVSINENSLQKRLNIQTEIGKERLLIKADTDIEKYNWNIEEINSIDEILESEDM